MLSKSRIKIQANMTDTFRVNCKDRTKHTENTDISHSIMWGTNSFTQH